MVFAVYPKYPEIPYLFSKSSQSDKIFGIFEKKLSLGVRSPWQWGRSTFSSTLLSKKTIRGPIHSRFLDALVSQVNA